jgi:two-component system, NarL family, response regulator DegU
MTAITKTENNKRVNIIIADDHPIFRDGLKSVMKKIPEVRKIYEAENGAETIILLEQFPVDIVFTDIEMPLMDGIECTKIIRLRYPNVKIIALTMFNSLKYVLDLYDEGVDGYILKNTDIEELSKSIKAVSNSEQYYTKEISDVLYSSLLKREIISNQKSELENITSREIEIMKMVCEQLTSLEISAKLFISPKTVERHKENIFLKTGTKNLAGLAVFAIKHGLYEIIK